MKVFIGFDPCEFKALVVAMYSLKKHASQFHDVRRLALDELRAKGLYTRATERRGADLWDVISEAPMSTEHAIARFFVPLLCDYKGWALFTDGDVLFRHDLRMLTNWADNRYAVMVVQHPPMPEQGTKKAGQTQTLYSRKNWSSVMLFNCGHPANRALDYTVLNTWPGRDLHAFRWLPDEAIGSLPLAYNWLVNVSEPVKDPAIVHFTLGIPDVPGHEHDPYADEWQAIGRAAGYRAEVSV